MLMRIFSKCERKTCSPKFEVQRFSKCLHVGLCGIGVTCAPRDPKFVGSIPAEVDGFFQDVKILSTCLPGGTLSWGSRV